MSDDLGLQKPDPKLFTHVLSTAGIDPVRTAMIGDRLDYDVRPAKETGMRAVWVLRGEAPDHPTTSQLDEADAAVHDLTEIPDVVARWS